MVRRGQDGRSCRQIKAKTQQRYQRGEENKGGSDQRVGEQLGGIA